MKTQEEIEQLSEKYSSLGMNSGLTRREYTLERIAYIRGYEQCQEDIVEILKTEIKRAFIHGQGNAQGIESGLERDEVEDYVNYRMLSFTKNKKD